MNAVNITKNQHYVPQFYLKRFANKSRTLQILDVKNNRLGSPRSYSSAGYKRYFYAIETGVPDDVSQRIERWLQQFETAIAQELPSIIDKILGNEHINDNDRYILSVLMSMLWLRSPSMRVHLNKMEEDITKQTMRLLAPERLDHYIRKTGVKMSDEGRAELIKTVETGSYKLGFNNAQHLRFMTETLGFGGPGFANMFFGQKWKIYIAKGKKRFVTSDSPVVEWWLPPKTFYGASFMERNKYFALTPEIFFELTFPVGSNKIKRKTIFEEEDNIVVLFNILVASHAQEYAYSDDKVLLEDLMAGRAKPGPIEMDYYERFERPWVEAKKSGRV
jgi:hypothetical protein